MDEPRWQPLGPSGDPDCGVAIRHVKCRGVGFFCPMSELAGKASPAPPNLANSLGPDTAGPSYS